MNRECSSPPGVEGARGDRGVDGGGGGSERIWSYACRKRYVEFYHQHLNKNMLLLLL